MPSEDPYRRIDEDLAVDENDISKEMATIPAKYVYWSNQLAEAKKILRENRLSFDVWMSHCRVTISDKAVVEGRKLTEQAKEDALIVTYEKEYLERQRSISEWMFKVDQLSGGVEGLSIKSKELITLGAAQRSERELSADRSLRQQH